MQNTDKKEAVFVILISLLLLFVGGIMYFFVIPTISHSSFDVSSPRIFFTASGNIAVLYSVQRPMSNESQCDMFLTVYDTSGNVVRGPEKIAHLNTSLQWEGISIPHSQANIVLDNHLNSYIVQVCHGSGVWPQRAELYVKNVYGKYTVKELVALESDKTYLTMEQISIYPVYLSLAGGRINIFLELQDRYQIELHYLQYSLSGKLIVGDTLLLSELQFGSKHYSGIMAVKNDIYVFLNSSRALRINATTHEMAHVNYSVRHIQIRINPFGVGDNYINETFSFLHAGGKYYPMSSDAVVYGDKEYVFYTMAGGCVGAHPALLMADFDNWNATEMNKTIYTPSSGKLGCYNPDIFGIHARTDESGDIYLVWYINDGCNHFIGYFMAIHGTHVKIAPRALPVPVF